MKTFLSITIGLVIGALAGSGTLFSASEPETKVASSEGKDHVMAQPVVHFEIAGKDGEKTREFYGKLFGWEYQLMEGMDYGLVQPAGDRSAAACPARWVAHPRTSRSMSRLTTWKNR